MCKSSIKCIRCKKSISDIPEIIENAKIANLEIDEYAKSELAYSEKYNAIVCTDCYIMAGMPSVPVKEISNWEEHANWLIEHCSR